MTLVRSANVIEGLGIEGDKHASAASKRQVLLADKEALDAVGVLPGTIKENVTVEGVDVMQLPAGSRLRSFDHDGIAHADDSAMDHARDHAQPSCELLRQSVTYLSHANTGPDDSDRLD